MIKKIIITILLIAFATVLFSCEKKNAVQEDVEVTQKNILDLEENVQRRKVSVAYFSFDDDVKEVAEKFKEVMEADIYEIEPVVPYTKEDLDFDDKNSRVYLEDEFDPFDSKRVVFDDEFDGFDAVPKATPTEVDLREKLTELPKIKSTKAKDYSIIVVGFPVWYENVPKVIYTFVKDLKNKIIIPFCTNGDMGMIDQYLSNFVDPSVRVMSGKRFNASATIDDIKNWVTAISVDFDIK